MQEGVEEEEWSYAFDIADKAEDSYASSSSSSSILMLSAGR